MLFLHNKYTTIKHAIIQNNLKRWFKPAITKLYEYNDGYNRQINTKTINFSDLNEIMHFKVLSSVVLWDCFFSLLNVGWYGVVREFVATSLSAVTAFASEL